MATVATLNVALKAQTRDLLRGLDRGARGIKTFVLKLEALKIGLRAIQNLSSRVARTFSSFASDALADVDALGKLSRNTSIAANDLQALSLAAQRSGITTQQLRSGLVAFTKRLGEAQKGAGELAPVLKELGLDPDQLIKAGGSEALRILFDEIDRLPTVFDKSRVAFKAFSDVGRQMVPIFEDGRTAIDGVVSEIDRMGGSLSAIDVQSVEMLNDSLNDTKFRLSLLARQFAVQLAPVILAAAEHVSDFADRFGGADAIARRVIEFMVRGFVAIQNAVNKVRSVITFLQAGILKVIGLISRLAEMLVSLFSRELEQSIRSFKSTFESESGRLFEKSRDLWEPIDADKILADFDKTTDKIRDRIKDLNRERITIPDFSEDRGGRAIQPAQRPAAAALQRGTVAAVSKVAQILNRGDSMDIAIKQLQVMKDMKKGIQDLAQQKPKVALAEASI